MRRLWISGVTLLALVIILLALLPAAVQAQPGQPDPETITLLVWHPSGERIAAASEDGTIRIYDVKSSQVLITLVGHTSFITAMAWSPDGNSLATTSADGSAWIWNPESGQAIHVIHEFVGFVVTLAWSVDGSVLFTGSLEDYHNLQAWNVASGELVDSSPSGSIVSLAASPDGRYIAAGRILGYVEVWETSNLASSTVWQLTDADAGDDVYELIWDAESTYTVEGTWDSFIRIRDAITGQLVQELHANDLAGSHQLNSVVDLTLTPDGTRLFSVTTDGTVRSWDALSWQLLETVDFAHGLWVAAWSPDASLLAYLDPDGEIVIADPFSM